jgi:hypothetical protein
MVIEGLFGTETHTMYCNSEKLSKNDMETVIWALEQKQEELLNEVNRIDNMDRYRGSEKITFSHDQTMWRVRCVNILRSVEKVLSHYKTVV